MSKTILCKVSGSKHADEHQILRKRGHVHAGLKMLSAWRHTVYIDRGVISSQRSLQVLCESLGSLFSALQLHGTCAAKSSVFTPRSRQVAIGTREPLPSLSAIPKQRGMAPTFAFQSGSRLPWNPASALCRSWLYLFLVACVADKLSLMVASWPLTITGATAIAGFDSSAWNNNFRPSPVHRIGGRS